MGSMHCMLKLTRVDKAISKVTLNAGIQKLCSASEFLLVKRLQFKEFPLVLLTSLSKIAVYTSGYADFQQEFCRGMVMHSEVSKRFKFTASSVASLDKCSMQQKQMHFFLLKSINYLDADGDFFLDSKVDSHIIIIVKTESRSTFKNNLITVL